MNKARVEYTNYLIKAINYWQTCGKMHPLTCGNKSSHKLLVPEIKNDEVVLKCEECEYIQKLEGTYLAALICDFNRDFNK